MPLVDPFSRGRRQQGDLVDPFQPATMPSTVPPPTYTTPSAGPGPYGAPTTGVVPPTRPNTGTRPPGTGGTWTTQTPAPPTVPNVGVTNNGYDYTTQGPYAGVVTNPQQAALAGATAATPSAKFQLGPTGIPIPTENPPPGFDLNKWHDPNYHTPKYDISRIVWSHGGNVKSAMPQIQALYPGAKLIGDDKIDFGTAQWEGQPLGVVDVRASNNNAWWGPVETGVGQGAGVGAGATAGTGSGATYPGATSATGYWAAGPGGVPVWQPTGGANGLSPAGVPYPAGLQTAGAGYGATGGSLFSDPISQQYANLIGQQVNGLLQPINDPNSALAQSLLRGQATNPAQTQDLNALLDYSRKLFQELQQPESPQMAQLRQTQFTEPLANTKDALQQQAIQRAAALGQGVSSGTVEQAMRQIGQQTAQSQAGGQASLAIDSLNRAQQRQQDALTVGGLLPQLESSDAQQRSAAAIQLATLAAQIRAEQNQNASQAVGFASQIPMLQQQAFANAQSVNTGSNPSAMFGNVLQLAGLGQQNSQWNQQQSQQQNQWLGQLITQLLGPWLTG